MLHIHTSKWFNNWLSICIRLLFYGDNLVRLIVFGKQSLLYLYIITSFYLHLVSNTANIWVYWVWDCCWKTYSSETWLDTNHWELHQCKEKEDSWSKANSVESSTLTVSTLNYCSASEIILAYRPLVYGEFFIVLAVYMG